MHGASGYVPSLFQYRAAASGHGLVPDARCRSRACLRRAGQFPLYAQLDRLAPGSVRALQRSAVSPLRSSGSIQVVARPAPLARHCVRVAPSQLRPLGAAFVCSELPRRVLPNWALELTRSGMPRKAGQRKPSASSPPGLTRHASAGSSAPR